MKTDIKGMFAGKTVLVTGGTGSFGKKFIRMTLKEHRPKKLIVFSRDEMKQWEMRNEFAPVDKHDVLRFFLGDVRDRDRLHTALNEVDFVVHAAATKIVPTAEYNPFEAIKTNINGAMNVIQASIDHRVKRVVALSTDKACNPINLYGATKLCSDKLFAAANAYVGRHDIRFSVVRYGNVMGSRGSIIPFFLKQAKKGEVTVTDKRMTRFMITLEHAVELVWHALADSIGGEIYVPKIPSMKVVDIARATAPRAEQKFIGIRPGEKIHELLISDEDARNTYEFGSYYKILPSIYDWHLSPKRIGKGKRVPKDFSYQSGTNKEWMTAAQLQSWLAREYKGEL